MITLTVAGVNYTDFVSASANNSLGTVSGTFNFEATSTATEVLPVKPGQTCSVLVDGVKVITGYVDVVTISYDSGSHSISISGRDKTADIVDCTMLASESDFSGKMSFKSLCETAIQKSGVTGVGVVDQANVKDFNAISLQSAAVGETIHGFLEKYARKRQVILTSNGDGDLVIAKPASLTAKTKLVNGINIKRANFTANVSSRYRAYVVKSQGGLASTDDGGDINLEQETSNEGVSTDTFIRQGRTLTIIDENASDKGGAQIRADWENIVRKSNSLTASVTIQGSGDSEVIIPNMKIKYQERYFADGDLPMLVKGVNYSYSLPGGSETTLELVRENAYTEQLRSAEFEKDAIDERTDNNGDQYEQQPDADATG